MFIIGCINVINSIINKIYCFVKVVVGKDRVICEKYQTPHEKPTSGGGEGGVCEKYQGLQEKTNSVGKGVVCEKYQDLQENPISGKEWG